MAFYTQTVRQTWNASTNSNPPQKSGVCVWVERVYTHIIDDHKIVPFRYIFHFPCHHIFAFCIYGWKFIKCIKLTNKTLYFQANLDVPFKRELHFPFVTFRYYNNIHIIVKSLYSKLEVGNVYINNIYSTHALCRWINYIVTLYYDTDRTCRKCGK